MVIASRLEAEVLAEKWHDMILKAIGDRTCMGSFVNLEAVLQTILIEYLVELGGINLETILVAHIHRDAFVLPQIADVLIGKSEGGIRRPLRENVGLWLTIFYRKIEIEGRILRIW
jgi:hypothetical protein